MSSTLPTLATPPETPGATPEGGQQGAQPDTLASLRTELDRLDDAVHDLLMERALVVGRIAALAAKGKVPLRPGREADIIRRLVRRHKGELPKRVLPRIWRELFAATTSMQGPYILAVCEMQGSPATEANAGGYVALTREHFGATTPLRMHRSPTQAIGEVSAGSATAAVLPMPSEEDTDRNAWWTSLLQRDTPRIHVVARLPFWSPRVEGAPQVRALVVSAAAPDRSAHDHSLVGLELPHDVSRARLATMVADAGFTASGILLRRDPQHPVAVALVDLDGFVADDDPRLAALGALRPPVVLGAYAMPIDGESA
jgi:chorismate mutase/prephenate dehydratase